MEKNINLETEMLYYKDSKLDIMTTHVTHNVN